MKKKKKQVTEWEKISVNHIRDNGLEYIRRKFNQKKQPIRKQAKDQKTWRYISPWRIYS